MREAVGHLVVGQRERIGQQPDGVQQPPYGQVEFGGVVVESGRQGVGRGAPRPFRGPLAEGDRTARVRPGPAVLAGVRGGADEPQAPQPAEDVPLGEGEPQLGDGLLGAAEGQVVMEPVRAGLGDTRDPM
ncbi:hypothetical protein [Streptomyces sp. NPDC013489]|uniref:hypothetical protein n=1 Tax=Streptomyces sp. NPDC013489 TaxID=3155606 RepID=UPI0033DBAF15